MSDRERWIVYPLLFLAIGLAMRNDFEQSDEGHAGVADVVRCKALEIVGPEGKPTVSISTSSKGDGLLELGNSQGELESKLGANTAGATLQLIDHEGKIYALVGHDGDRVGLFAGDTESSRVLSLISVLTHPPATDQKSGSEQKAAANEKSVAPKKKSSDDKIDSTQIEKAVDRKKKIPEKAPATSDESKQETVTPPQENNPATP
jgi:hypothetical protein